MYNYPNAKTELVNSLVWSNSATTATVAERQIYSVGSNVTIENSVIQDGMPTGATDQGGNSIADPLFVNVANPAGVDNVPGTADDGLSLRGCSPAVNTGGATTLVTTSDVTGRARVVGSTVDRGAYEFVPGSGSRFYVKSGSTGSGSSWADAAGDLQLALDNACNGINEIWVAAGTYLPTTAPAGCTACGPRDVTFVLKDGVKLYGGFPATGDPLFTDRNPASFSTILSGDIGTLNVATDNAHHVVSAFNSGANTVIDGFIITKGNADLPIWKNGVNSVYTYDSFTISRGSGAGIHMQKSALQINQVIFLANNADQEGGAIINKWMQLAPVSTSITNSTFTSNTTDDNVGGAISDYGTSTYLKNVVFNNNRANNGGAVYSDGKQRLVIENCSFINHKNAYPDGYGGALYVTHDFTVRNSVFKGNTLKRGLGGAIAIYSWGDGSPDSQNLIENCVFENNGGNSNGGASNGTYGSRAYEGGAIWSFSRTPLLVKETAFKGNMANYGGAINLLNNDNLFTCVGCTFEENDAKYLASGEGSGYGAAVCTDEVSLYDRCVFINNKSDYAGGAIYTTGSVITNSVFAGNKSLGGAIENTGGHLTVLNSTLFGNISYPYVGAARVAIVDEPEPLQTILAEPLKTQTLERVGREAAVAAERQRTKRLTRSKSTAVLNGAGRSATASEIPSTGSAIYNYPNATIELVNSLVWSNSATAASAQERQIYTVNANTYIKNSIIQDGIPTAATDQGGNTAADPKFVNAANPAGDDNQFRTADDGLYIGHCSPAVDAGTSTSIVMTQDITGGPRVLNDKIDIGAYENAPYLSPITITPASVTVAAGQPVELTASGGMSFTWNTPASGTTITVSPTQTTVYSVSGIDANGCLGQASATVSVSCVVVTPQIAQASFNTVLAPGNCPATLDFSVTGNSAVLTNNEATYIFSSVYRKAGSNTFKALNINKPGTYTLTVSSKGSCGQVEMKSIQIVISGTGCN